MKKIFISFLAVAALAACTKSGVTYDEPAEIGFKAVAGNITKAAIDGDVYPDNLNMYVYAYTTGNTAATADYIVKGEFKHKSAVDGTQVWGGITPYYWPNTKNLHFAGLSKSGNAATATVAYNCTSDVLTISGYSAKGTDDNDLMYFPSTKATQPNGFDRNDKYVPVEMYHTCAWLSFYVKGDTVTGADGSTYKVTGLTVTGIDDTADLTCTGTTVAWANNTATDATVDVLTSGNVALTQTAALAETAPNSTIVIPQTPGKLSVTYSYTSPAGTTITETKDDLDLALAVDADDNKGPNQWKAGQHYIYTITIKANEILIAPKPLDWDDENWNITVE